MRCIDCHGEGEVLDSPYVGVTSDLRSDRDREHARNEPFRRVPCPTCGGSGDTDVAPPERARVLRSWGGEPRLERFA